MELVHDLRETSWVAVSVFCQLQCEVWEADFPFLASAVLQVQSFVPSSPSSSLFLPCVCAVLCHGVWFRYTFRLDRSWTQQCVCVCVCVNVNVHAHVLVCMHMCVCLCVCICMSAWVHVSVCMHACVCVCVCVRVYSDLNDYSEDQWLSLKLRQCAC